MARRPRGRSGPSCSSGRSTTLPGRRARRSRRRLAKLGLERVGDLLAHRPRRYETGAGARIADLFGDEEVVIAGVVRAALAAARRGRLTILTARVADGSGEIGATWFNQPWLEDKLRRGRACGCAASRTATASTFARTT